MTDLFISDARISPTYQTLLVDALDRMAGVADREAFVESAVRTEGVARSLTGLTGGVAKVNAREVWLGGRASAEMLRAMEANGWKVHLNAAAKLVGPG